MVYTNQLAARLPPPLQLTTIMASGPVSNHHIRYKHHLAGRRRDGEVTGWPHVLQHSQTYYTLAVLRCSLDVSAGQVTR